MNKIKDMVMFIQKYHVWVLCVVVACIGAVGWKAATGALSDEGKKNEGEIKRQFTMLKSKVFNEKTPNKDWIDKINVLIEETQQQVFDSWEDLYASQQTFFDWPKDNEYLGDAFEKSLKKLKDDGALTPEDKNRFQNYLAHLFDDWLEKVKAKKFKKKKEKKDQGVEEVEGPPEVQALDLDRFVEWPDQINIQDTLFKKGQNAKTRKQVESTYRTLKIQESLLSIIEKTNANATAKYNAAIKKIVHIKVIEQKSVQAVSQPKPAPKGRLGGKRGRTPTKKKAAGTKPPAESEKLWQEVNVSMELIVDQEKISNLLVECVNSPLPIDIQHLEIIRDLKSKGAKVQLKGQGPGGGISIRIIRKHSDVRFVLHGKIYLVNQPDSSLLGIKSTAKR